MARTQSALTACFALLLASAAPAFAGCGEGSFCPPPAAGPTASAPQSGAIVIPPIVMQQIETASGPISLPDGPPLADNDDDTTVTQVTPFNGDGGIKSVTDLDSGLDAWGYIAPGEDTVHLPPKGLTYFDRTTPAPHARPAPPQTEVSIGLNLTMEVPAPLAQKGVPGIDRPTLASGNRALWYSSAANN
jgi:hypothetical protein